MRTLTIWNQKYVFSGLPIFGYSFTVLLGVLFGMLLKLTLHERMASPNFCRTQMSTQKSFNELYKLLWTLKEAEYRRRISIN
eukprot:TRINITY_DN14237_c0_g1_i1.p2 TRINITY_DN14237_c0_g1~~TRINITY_DN14237_c0_g1_i1.p2  ORF type:complete len:82 (+),score=7.37 TRINITY_DN14237_c0_g1_i1:271-516(+)